MQILTPVLFGILCVLGSFRARWLLALLVVFFAMEVSLQGSSDIFRSETYLANVIVALITGFYLAMALPRQQQPLAGYFSRTTWLVLLLFSWSILSLAWSPAMPYAHNTGSNIIRACWPQFVLTVLLTPLLIRSVDDWKDSMLPIIVAGSLVTLSIVLNPQFDMKNGRIGIVLGGHDRTSPLAIGQIGGTLAIISALYVPTTAITLTSILRVVGFLMGSLLALESGSRGQILFSGLIILAFYPVSRKLKNVRSFVGNALSLLILLAVAYFAFVAVMETSSINRWESQYLAHGADVRIGNILSLLAAFATSGTAWLVGLGFNAFSAVADTIGQGYSHSTFVDVFAELGIPAFCVLIAIVLSGVRCGRALFNRYRDDPPRRAAVAALLAMITYQVLLSNKEGNLWSSVNLFMFIIVINRIEACTRIEGMQFDKQSPIDTETAH
jgi:hypothetical protein